MAKTEVLHYLAEHGGVDASQVAAALGLDAPAAGMALLRLVRQGLANREFDGPTGAYVYALTDKGLARLAYFDGDAE